MELVHAGQHFEQVALVHRAHTDVALLAVSIGATHGQKVRKPIFAVPRVFIHARSSFSLSRLARLELVSEAMVFEQFRAHLDMTDVTLHLRIQDICQNWTFLGMRRDLARRQETAAELAQIAFALSVMRCKLVERHCLPAICISPQLALLLFRSLSAWTTPIVEALAV